MVKPKILLADDKKQDLERYAEILREENFEVIAAASFGAAKELLETQRFDLAVLDLHLKRGGTLDLSGIQLAEKYGHDSFPIIILTGEATVEAAKRALQQRKNGPAAVRLVEKDDGPEAFIEAVRFAFKPKVFVAHGHDKAARDTVVDFLKGGRLRVVVLQAETGVGQVIIEKFEEHSNVQFAIVLVTPDDVGGDRVPEPKLRHRARQNVIFELGYFLGKLGRDRVVVLYKEEGEKIDIPSNYEGVGYIPMDPNGGWRVELLEKIEHAGIEV
jgi:predicted nucleotide-binding protein